MLSRSDLHGYQNRIVDFLWRPLAALWVDLGLGKTVSVLTFLSDLLEKEPDTRVLIVAPPRVARLVWPLELAKWEHLAGLSLYVYDKSNSKRLENALNDTQNIHVISSSLITWLAAQKKLPHYDVLVIDESHEFKNNSKRTKAMIRLRKKIDPSRVIQMTATPAANEYEDLFYQFRILDNGERLLKTKRDFEGYFYQPYCAARWEKPELKPNADIAIQKRISDVVLRLDGADYLDLPPVIYNCIDVALPSPAMKIYNEMYNEMLVEWETGGITVTGTAVGRDAKLRQVCNGFMYDEDDTGTRTTHHIHDVKIKALRELYDGLNTPLLVVYEFNEDKRRILDAFPLAKVIDKDGALVSEWNAGQIPMFLIHPASGGVGLNLQSGGYNIVMLSESWDLTQYLQMIGRLARQGQTMPVVVHHLTAISTIEKKIRRRREQKHETQDELLRGVIND